MQLNYREAGSGPPIVILHGLFGSSANWMTISRELSNNYHVITVDLRNHGESPWSDTWDLNSMSEDVLELIETKGLKEPVIMGHSLGGKVAMTFASRYYPYKLSRLIVVDIAPRTYPIEHDKIIDALLAIDLDQIESRADADAALAPVFSSKMLRQFLLKNLNRCDSGFKWQINLEVIRRNLSVVAQSLPDHIEVRVPALFIRGENSQYIHDEDLTVIRKHFPVSELETIAGAGHWVHAEKPDPFLATVSEYLARKIPTVY